MAHQHIGFRVFPSLSQAERLRAAIDKAAGYPKTGQERRHYRNGVLVATDNLGVTEHLVSVFQEPGGSRAAVQITDMADAYHGVSVDLPEQSPAQVVIDARTDRVPVLPWE